ncbi:MAG: hypothetical protein KIS88_03545 [Anaerolineales bacterium]|nr:hypothetical protein [Anaerolineales bacterium]
MEDPEIYLAYLDIKTFDDGRAFRGGCLVTDISTNPLEFRCTSAISPTELQRLLYGKQLFKHISEDLSGVQLLNKLATKVSLILVRKPAFLAIRPIVETPILLVETSPDGKTSGVTTHPDFVSEISGATNILKTLGEQGLLEPFDRVSNAITLAHENKVGDEV